MTLSLIIIMKVITLVKALHNHLQMQMTLQQALVFLLSQGLEAELMPFGYG